MPPLAPPDGPTLTGANLKSGIVAELIQLADRLGVDSRLWFEGMRLDNWTAQPFVDTQGS